MAAAAAEQYRKVMVGGMAMNSQPTNEAKQLNSPAPADPWQPRPTSSFGAAVVVTVAVVVMLGCGGRGMERQGGEGGAERWDRDVVGRSEKEKGGKKLLEMRGKWMAGVEWKTWVKVELWYIVRRWRRGG